uniref:Uncharacterized protein n=1 Tax=Rhizophora mucronata TaxID=61149 RepID=A0A2P2LKG9_RHIMU
MNWRLEHTRSSETKITSEFKFLTQLRKHPIGFLKMEYKIKKMIFDK